jgi:RNA methyltransferase, TrmH family
MISTSQIKFINSLKLKKFREQHAKFIAEGSRLVLDLVDSPIRVHEIFAYTDWISEHSARLKGSDINCFTVSEKEMVRISALVSPSPVLAVVDIPLQDTVPDSLADDFILVLDDIKDPGNFGTILRIADWFGMRTVICSENMVDLYNPKVVQATMGSIARVKVFNANLPRFLEGIKGTRDVFGTFMTGENVYSYNLPPSGIIVIGSESAGISPEVAEYVTTRLAIPSFQNSNARSVPESLNAAVATAVICSEFRRRVATLTR